MLEFKSIIRSCKEFKKEAIELLGTGQSLFEFEENHGIYDIVIITATADEFESIKTVLNNVKPVVFNQNDATIYYHGIVEGKTKTLKVLIPFPYSMGLEAVSALSTKVISKFRPRYIFMAGICAGNKNLCKIGDVVIAEKSLNYHGIVEIERKDQTRDKKFMHNLCSINGHLKNKLELFAKSNLIKSIQENYPNSDKINTNLSVHIGLLITGSSLMRSETQMMEINSTYTGVKGLDMETYGLYYSATQVYNDYAPNFLSIKSVSDFGDNSNHKLSTQERKKYGLYTSANALLSFIKNYIE